MISRYEQFSYIISCIYRQIQKIERDEMIKYGVRGSCAQYLAAMSRHPEGMTSTQLCEVCDRDKAAVSRALADMEDHGLVMRQSATDSNYRAMITLTQQGKELAAIVFDRAQAAVDAAGHGLTDEDRKVFYAALDLIATNLQVICRNGIPAKKETKGEPKE